MKQRIPNAPVQSISRDYRRMGEGLFGCESQSCIANQRVKAPARLIEDFEVENLLCLSVGKSELDEIVLLMGVATGTHLPHVSFNIR